MAVTIIPKNYSFFSAMANTITPEAAHSTVVAPLEKLAQQTEKAAHIRQDPFNQAAAKELSNCMANVTAILAGNKATLNNKTSAEETPEENVSPNPF